MTTLDSSAGFGQERKPVLLGFTQNSFFSQNVGQSGLENLDADQLRERLMVAETIMKRLYSRNKELEEYHADAQNGAPSSTKIPLKGQASGQET